MKAISSTVYAAAFSALSVNVVASPLVNNSSTTIEQWQNVDWSFALYQNAECTGATDSYSGFGSVQCTAGVRNGNAPAYQKRFVNADCAIGFYSDVDCNNAIDFVDEGNDIDCHTPAQGGTIAAYDVVCWFPMIWTFLNIEVYIIQNC